MSDLPRIQHVNVLVDDLEPAVRFYRDTLGLRPIEAPDQGFPSQFFELNEHQQIHMNQIVDGKAYRAHFCMVVPDFMGVFRRCKAAGAIDVEPWGRVRRLPSGNMQMFVRDPAGNLIEISCRPDAPLDEAMFDDELFERERGMYTVPKGTAPPRP
jgi:catechol 2,3-dioxygenase-like lactoylglutathione lyase family enzyme